MSSVFRGALAQLSKRRPRGAARRLHGLTLGVLKETAAREKRVAVAPAKCAARAPPPPPGTGC